MWVVALVVALCCCLLLIAVFIVRVLITISKHKKVKLIKDANNNLIPPSSPPKHRLLSILIVLGSGGHTTELLLLLDQLNLSKCKLTFFIADTDKTSQQKCSDYFTSQQPNIEQCELLQLLQFIRIPRSREVGQSYLSTIPATLYSMLRSLIEIQSLNPDLILCNGPGTCVPVCYGARFLEVFGLISSTPKIIFIESFCRVKSLSLSGKLLLPIVDECIVQWETLAELYPTSTRYVGQLL